jgi:hypothetical protein
MRRGGVWRRPPPPRRTRRAAAWLAALTSAAVALTPWQQTCLAMSERGFGIVSGTDTRDWRNFAAWDDMLPRKDGVALAVSNKQAAQQAAAVVGHVPTYDELGVHRIINARGAYTVLGGSLMLPEVKAAMIAAAESFVDLEELQEAVGARLAQLMGAEFAIVSNGACAAITQVVAACIAGTDSSIMKRLPDTTGIPNEVVIQKSHLGEYDHAIQAAGGKIVVVESLEEMQAAIGRPSTVLCYALGVRPCSAFSQAALPCTSFRKCPCRSSCFAAVGGRSSANEPRQCAADGGAGSASRHTAFCRRSRRAARYAQLLSAGRSQRGGVFRWCARFSPDPGTHRTSEVLMDKQLVRQERPCRGPNLVGWSWGVASNYCGRLFSMGLRTTG